MANVPHKGVVLLLGPPGPEAEAGKSLLGSALVRAHSRVTAFLNMGAQLCSEGLVGVYLAHPTLPSNQALLRSRARSILEGACASLQAEAGAR